ncbi:hypothetical protein [Kribbella sp. CA-247076]|uniref:hypothetical protein n=1 Tax=Kribbella sp. CA-247076 TaxID=3239941 RepID=UPI003D8E484E
MISAKGPQHGGRLPGLTVQREVPTIALHARLIGTLEIDPSTNCLVVRMAVGTVVRTGDRLVSVGDRLVDVDVAWPPRWSVAIRDGEVALVDATGQTAARLGDEVDVGGGFVDTAAMHVVSCTGQDRIFQASGLSES